MNPNPDPRRGPLSQSLPPLREEITVKSALLAPLSNSNVESVGQRAGEKSQPVKGAESRFRALAPGRRVQFLPTAGEVSRLGRGS